MAEETQVPVAPIGPPILYATDAQTSSRRPHIGSWDIGSCLLLYLRHYRMGNGQQ